MIKIDNGTIEITGAFPVIMANLSTLVHHLYHSILTKNAGMSPEEAKETILSAVEDGFMSKDEVHAMALEALAELTSDPETLMNMLKDVFSKKG